MSNVGSSSSVVLHPTTELNIELYHVIDDLFQNSRDVAYLHVQTSCPLQLVNSIFSTLQWPFTPYYRQLPALIVCDLLRNTLNM